MDRSFDLVALLKQQPTAKTHKIRPTQFLSVAGGVQKRLETNIKNRKTSRLSVFDRIRNISKCASPRALPLSEVQQRADHRKQQLEKWKEEKEKAKKEAAALKKKPFVAGATHRATFGPPPPPKAIPSSSGRVTRSQASRQRIEHASKQPPSFAPSNASFKPPKFKKDVELPTLAPISKKKINKSKPNFIFEPIVPKTIQSMESLRTTRSRTNLIKPVLHTTDSKLTHKQNDKPKPKSKSIPKIPPLKQNMFQSSSSSDVEQPVKKSYTKMARVQNNNYGRQPRKVNPKVASKTLTPQSDSNSEMENIAEASSQPQPMYSSSSSSDMEQVTEVPVIAMVQQPTQKSTENSSEESHSTPKAKIPKSESNSEEKLRSPKNLCLPLTPEEIKEEADNISPCVTLSRGKDNARREMKKKLHEGLLDEDSCHIDSVNHFRRQLNSEIARLTAMCDTWDKIFTQTVLPEPVQELVLTAVGQGRLLMSQKLQQFAGLVEACARPAPGAALVTPADLHGFWDMVFMQVENVDVRFKQLEAMRARDWAAEAPAPPARRARPARPAPRPAPAGPSRLREMIAVARKIKKEQESQSSQSGSDGSPAPLRTFDAGFFRVSSPTRPAPPSPTAPPAPATPANKSTLLKSVLSSEARKASASKSSTSFAMLRASLMSKNVDIEGVSPLLQTPPPVNLFATPARSILKARAPSAKPDRLKTVLFCDGAGAGGDAECQGEGEGEGKENLPASRRRSRLSRQNATDTASPAGRRRSARAPLAEAELEAGAAPRRSARHVAEAPQGTPRRSSRRRQSAAAV